LSLEKLGSYIAEQLFGLGIHEDEPPIAVERKESLSRPLENGSYGWVLGRDLASPHRRRMLAVDGGTLSRGP
jgi:hypothetical protein